MEHYINIYFKTFNIIKCDDNNKLSLLSKVDFDIKDKITFQYIKYFEKTKSEKIIIPIDNTKQKIILNDTLITKKKEKDYKIREILVREINRDKNDTIFGFTKSKLVDFLTEDEDIELTCELIDNYFPDGIEKHTDIRSINNEIKNIKDEIDNVETMSEIVINSDELQYHTNKVFLSKAENGKKTYYIYFSFGKLKNIENVDWNKTLNPYIDYIQTLIENNDVENIILAGHSFGAIMIQKIGIELINKNMSIEKIFIIGSGCRYKNSLNEQEFILFKHVFENKYFFAITNYTDSNGNNFFDHYDTLNTKNIIEQKKIHKITTHFLTARGNPSLDQITNFEGIISNNTLHKIKHDEINNVDSNYIGINNITLHDFTTYSQFYF